MLNHFYGRDSVPIGAYNVATPGAALEVGTVAGQQLPYVGDLVRRFESPIKNSTEVEDAVTVYRRVLAAQADRSVAISSIGIHTNLAALLQSGADEYSRLTGRELVAAKVATLAVMGGTYPSGGGCNLVGGGFWLGPGWDNNSTVNGHNHFVASAASAYVAKHWPTESKIIWSGSEVGSKVQSGGAGFQQRCPAVATARNPCAAAVINYEHGANKGRMSWDPLTTLVAVRGAAAASTRECTDCDGHNVVDPRTGKNTWVRGRKTNQTYLVLRDAKQAGEELNSLLCQPSKLNPLTRLETAATIKTDDGHTSTLSRRNHGTLSSSADVAKVLFFDDEVLSAEGLQGGAALELQIPKKIGRVIVPEYEWEMWELGGCEYAVEILFHIHRLTGVPFAWRGV
eukprot:SAG31_NODE_1772_length_7306_cov_3.341335_11_plen_398_part_00